MTIPNNRNGGAMLLYLKQSEQFDSGAGAGLL